ncbi:UvrD-helicase domain-containing protein [Anatilimnocola sp. NA78]|uniref:UvrD-helicase domain-containing protein n=1 Tax=Anatilimnocola sp. NA78 TaxID=3415683 RepID=UPI003CE49819
MRLIAPENWIPIEIDGLEPAADAAVRDLSSGIIVAGPGAGKTELLAQRACFLFQTGLCPAPKRILAISFKRDAASNLRRRVRKRCGHEAARRFDSMTYDSFAKSLIDRFLAGLPATHRPTEDYGIELDLDRAVKVRQVLNVAAPAASSLVEALIRSEAEEAFFDRQVVGRKLVEVTNAGSDQQRLAAEVWRVLLFGGTASRLNFTMMGRLAELMLRNNPKVLRALRATYQFVFLDEFQDTTGIQYDLTLAAFKGSASSMTAVGDPKQRIMLWAGALDGVFKHFQQDFSAKHHQLAMNYRSAPDLVRIQHYLIAALEPGAVLPQAHRQAKDGGGECRAFLYPDHRTEARHLAEYLAGVIQAEGTAPADVCILMRTWNDRYSKLLIEELGGRGIAARVERDLQDLLAEPGINLVLQFLRLSISARSPEAWTEVMETCLELWGIEAGSRTAESVERKLASARRLVGDLVQVTDGNIESVTKVLKQILELFGEKAVKQAFPQYRQGTFLAGLLDQVAQQLSMRILKPLSWLEALNDLEGANSIPIMTVHKSKGLEYHTVVFVGLEDSSLWNFRKSPDEEKCGFFVAFSRAIKTVVFTFSEYRPRTEGGTPEKQSRAAIGELYALLEQAGVRAEQISTAE